MPVRMTVADEIDPWTTDQAELVELSRRKGRERDSLAAEADAKGDHAGAAEHRRIAAAYREEADLQSAFIPVRRPGVRNARDKARACGEPTIADVKAGRR